MEISLQDERQDHRGACDLHMDNCEDLAKGFPMEDRDHPGAKKQKLNSLGFWQEESSGTRFFR